MLPLEVREKSRLFPTRYEQKPKNPPKNKKIKKIMNAIKNSMDCISENAFGLVEKKYENHYPWKLLCNFEGFR
jgi:hypothetical protein